MEQADVFRLREPPEATERVQVREGASPFLGVGPEFSVKRHALESLGS